jgi:hypothetical protein
MVAERGPRRIVVDLLSMEPKWPATELPCGACRHLGLRRRPTMPELSVYKDDLITVKVPAYLRIKKPDPRAKEIAWYFVADRRKCKKPQIEGLLVILVDRETADTIRLNSLTVKPMDWQGVKQKIIRRGEPDFLPRGVEFLSGSYNTINGDINYHYDLLFPKGGHLVHVDISGQDDLSKFDTLCKGIVLSIRLTDDKK